MMHVVKIRPEKREALSAVCHHDHTGRLHTVTRSQNPLYYDLIKTFSERSGVPAVLNTSFNENEPIVETPEQAVNCFVRTDIDVLALGPFVTVKRSLICVDLCPSVVPVLLLNSTAVFRLTAGARGRNDAARSVA